MDGQPTTMPTKDGVEAAREWLEAHVFRVFLHEIKASPARYEAVLTAVATLTTRISELEKGLKDLATIDPYLPPKLLTPVLLRVKAEASRLLEGRQ